LDNDVTSVVIATILQGTLLKNGIQVEPGTILEPGDILVYIPPLDASGQLNAFTITASDKVSSSEPLLISVNVTAITAKSQQAQPTTRMYLGLNAPRVTGGSCNWERSPRGFINRILEKAGC
jgi:hypothetical protein